MNIGNLLNDQSPKTAAASLPDLRPLNDPQLAPESAGERRTMSMNTSHHVGSHPNYSSAAYSYQTPPSISAYPQLIPGGYSSQSQQMLAAPQGPPSLKQEGSAISAGSDMRAASSTHHESEGKSPEDAAPRTSELPKNFACSTCGKGFARRSDLVRHERIHSGIRPHKCPWPYCEKQFIQRSALTVHERVHSGEKPHMCEKCSKQFSDSSSLARHRRIHSGKRPYKCPYPDCQKTFTRRTTLTRHQNNHTGSLEEAAANRAAALASHASAQIPEGQSERGVGDNQSDASSSTHSQPQHHASGMQQPSLSRAPSYSQALPPNYYSSNLPPPPANMGTPGPSSTPSSRAPSTVDSHHQYRPPAQPYAASSQAHPASHSPSGGVMASAEGYHGYPSDGRYQPPGYPSSSGYYPPPQSLRPQGGQDTATYEHHGQMSAWTQSTQSM